MNRHPTILVIDDDPGIVAWLVDALQEEGFHVEGETSADKALDLLKTRGYDLVISDIEMPHMRGIDLMPAIHRARPGQMVLLVTAFGSIDLAVQAVRLGAVDFLAKPFRIEALILAIRRALEERQMRREIVRLREDFSPSEAPGIAARSPAMAAVLELSARAAKSALPILITGESGVGKGALTAYIHAASARCKARFVHLNCAALPASIAEAELFGVRRGAFTDAREDRAGVFEMAHQGTLFLDEIGELPLEVQPKLLQALEANHVRPLGGSSLVLADVRIVAATNRSLEEGLQARSFRPDLYHRLNVIRIEIPPLRERVADIDLIVDQVLTAIARKSGDTPLGVSLDAMQWLRAHSWPGNVRELTNALERAVALADHDTLTLDDFVPHHGRPPSSLGGGAARGMSLAELEKAHIRRVLLQTGGHKANAAKILGLDRRTLYRKVAELDF